MTSPGIFSASAPKWSRMGAATPSVHAREAEEDVLGTDVVVAEVQGLTPSGVIPSAASAPLPWRERPPRALPL
jgi:hypothetical protein